MVNPLVRRIKKLPTFRVYSFPPHEQLMCKHNLAQMAKTLTNAVHQRLNSAWATSQPRTKTRRWLVPLNTPSRRWGRRGQVRSFSASKPQCPGRLKDAVTFDQNEAASIRVSTSPYYYPLEGYEVQEINCLTSWVWQLMSSLVKASAWGLHNYRRRDNGQERLETPSYALPTINHDDTLTSMTSMTSKCQWSISMEHTRSMETRNPYQPAGRGQSLQKQQRLRAVHNNLLTGAAVRTCGAWVLDAFQSTLMTQTWIQVMPEKAETKSRYLCRSRDLLPTSKRVGIDRGHKAILYHEQDSRKGTDFNSIPR